MKPHRYISLVSGLALGIGLFAAPVSAQTVVSDNSHQSLQMILTNLRVPKKEWQPTKPAVTVHSAISGRPIPISKTALTKIMALITRLTFLIWGNGQRQTAKKFYANLYLSVNHMDYL